MDKTRLRAAVLKRLQEDLDNLTRAALMARDEATHEESRPENKYDTHSQEAAYLAEGQARLAAELLESIKLFGALPVAPFAAGQPIALGAYVVTDAGRGKVHYLLGPKNGGIEVECDGAPLVVVTPQSPIGRLLLGKKAGDSFSQSSGSRLITTRVVSVE
jgi:transcription elongation GreA/GreB family factor